MKLSSAAPFVPTLLKTFVNHADSIYTDRVHNRKLILENPAKPSKARVERLERREKAKNEKKGRRTGVVSRKEAREKRFWKFDENQAKCVVAVFYIG